MLLIILTWTLYVKIILFFVLLNTHSGNILIEDVDCLCNYKGSSFSNYAWRQDKTCLNNLRSIKFRSGTVITRDFYYILFNCSNILNSLIYCFSLKTINAAPCCLQRCLGTPWMAIMWGEKTPGAPCSWTQQHQTVWRWLFSGHFISQFS